MDHAVEVAEHPYTMRISRMTVDKLGVRLYDKVSAVLAELVANAYDADAESVRITAPMGELLATKPGGVLRDKGYNITVEDDGHGMTPDEVRDFYLVVGKERRTDARRGDRSRRHRRKVMGRKGVGKLAPFGICSEIEVLTAGGEVTEGHGIDGNPTTGYLTAHLVLRSGGILHDTDEPYHPEPGAYDQRVSPSRGTKVILRDFEKRWVPEVGDLGRQLAQRFGVRGANWNVILCDSQKSPGDEDHSMTVGEFHLDVNPATRYTIGETTDPRMVRGPNNLPLAGFEAGFDFEDKFYSIHGWIAYAANPYKDDLMAGVRIYCNGKIAAQTSIFNQKAGFTGEHDIRSYLVGELHVDWLDEEEDLIQTDRRDIIWSSDLGVEFERWGQRLVKHIGSTTRRVIKISAWDQFRSASNIEARIAEAFPANDHEPLRRRALQLAQTLGEKMRPDEIDSPPEVEQIVNFSLRFAPHAVLDEELTKAADGETSALVTVSRILTKARVAELSSFGQIAEKRLKVISKVESLKNDASSDESALQKLLTEAPWLVDPQWSPVTANRWFSTLVRELEKFLRDRGIEATLSTTSDARNRPDFVFANHGGYLEVIEIKKPGKPFDDLDFERFWRYVDLFAEFWSAAGNEVVVEEFPRRYRFTVISDDLAMNSVNAAAIESLRTRGQWTHISWASFLARTKQAHQEFLAEADRQIREAPTQAEV